MRIENRVAIITGSARGIGRATALKFAQEGAKLSLADIDEEKLEMVKKETEKKGGIAITTICNVKRFEEVLHMVQNTIESFGRLDILVNNAGLIRRGTIETVTESEGKLGDITSAPGYASSCRRSNKNICKAACTLWYKC